MRDTSDAPGRTGEPRQAGGGAAAEGGRGVDLSLGHLGTQGQDSPGQAWLAVCDACHASLGETAYQAAEAAAPGGLDPACPRCGVALWSFHTDLLA